MPTGYSYGDIWLRLFFQDDLTFREGDVKPVTTRLSLDFCTFLGCHSPSNLTFLNEVHRRGWVPCLSACGLLHRQFQHTVRHCTWLSVDRCVGCARALGSTFAGSLQLFLGHSVICCFSWATLLSAPFPFGFSWATQSPFGVPRLTINRKSATSLSSPSIIDISLPALSRTLPMGT